MRTLFLSRALSALFLSAALSLSTALDAQTPSPYAGQEARGIKALSNDDVAALLTGEGMGYAKAAELNSYPGPRHAIDLAEVLKLTPEQERRIRVIYAVMNDSARGLGREIVAREARLDSLFASRRIDPVALDTVTADVARLEGRLRAVHLRAHLEVTRLLSAEQVAAYDAARGYHPGGHDAHQGHEPSQSPGR